MLCPHEVRPDFVAQAPMGGEPHKLPEVLIRCGAARLGRADAEAPGQGVDLAGRAAHDAAIPDVARAIGQAPHVEVPGLDENPNGCLP